MLYVTIWGNALVLFIDVCAVFRIIRLSMGDAYKFMDPVLLLSFAMFLFMPKVSPRLRFHLHSWGVLSYIEANATVAATVSLTLLPMVLFLWEAAIIGVNLADHFRKLPPMRLWSPFDIFTAFLICLPCLSPLYHFPFLLRQCTATAISFGYYVCSILQANVPILMQLLWPSCHKANRAQGEPLGYRLIRL